MFTLVRQPGRGREVSCSLGRCGGDLTVSKTRCQRCLRQRPNVEYSDRRHNQAARGVGEVSRALVARETGGLRPARPSPASAHTLRVSWRALAPVWHPTCGAWDYGRLLAARERK